jgi:hypothetical protein
MARCARFESRTFTASREAASRILERPRGHRARNRAGPLRVRARARRAMPTNGPTILVTLTSTSVPSGSSAGSSTTTWPFRTWALSACMWIILALARRSARTSDTDRRSRRWCSDARSTTSSTTSASRGGPPRNAGSHDSAWLVRRVAGGSGSNRFAKVDVEGSNPFSRSIKGERGIAVPCRRSTLGEVIRGAALAG